MYSLTIISQVHTQTIHVSNGAHQLALRPISLALGPEMPGMVRKTEKFVLESHKFKDSASKIPDPRRWRH